METDTAETIKTSNGGAGGAIAGDQFDPNSLDALPKFQWGDIQPIYQTEQETAVVSICYSKEFKEVFAYLRALMVLDEHSERALELTKQAGFLNPANYTVWQYRRRILKSLAGADMYEELRFTREVIDDDPKNYQVWHHRQQVIDWINKADGELDFINSVLATDAKNYHAWQHRHWVVRHFNMWNGELELSNTLLQGDVRNNSAWNYRYFIITNTTGYDEDTLSKEIKYTCERIKEDPHNESAWNYLNGIVPDDQGPILDDVMVQCRLLYDEKKCRSLYLLNFMADKMTEVKEDPQKIAQIYDELLAADPIRSEYWKLLKRTVLNAAA